MEPEWFHEMQVTVMLVSTSTGSVRREKEEGREEGREGGKEE